MFVGGCHPAVTVCQAQHYNSAGIVWAVCFPCPFTEDRFCSVPILLAFSLQTSLFCHQRLRSLGGDLGESTQQSTAGSCPSRPTGSACFVLTRMSCY